MTNKVSQLVIFDCDGVLVDSEAISARVATECLNEYGFVISMDEVMRRFTGISDKTMRQLLFAETGRELPSDFDAFFVKRTNEALTQELQATPHIAEILSSLPEKCVASSGVPEKIANSLRVTDLRRFFNEDRIFSATMVSQGKPAPDLFLHAARMVGFSPKECVVIEDSVAGTQAGCAAGRTGSVPKLLWL